VDPHQEEETCGFRYYCGAGLAFKLVGALFGRDKMLEYADLAALATVADIVPLKDENRIIVAAGLKAINSQPRVGIKALMDMAGIRRRLTSSNLAFMLAPRINAGGRMDRSDKNVTLLTTQDEQLARQLAEELEGDNNRRKALCDEMFIQASLRAEKEVDFLHQAAIVLWDEKWNTGVLGIVAARLVERYHRPVALLGADGGEYHGSLRSIDGVNIHEALTMAEETMLRYGGHMKAAGVSVAADKLPAFKAALLQAVAAQMAYVDPVPGQKYDLKVSLKDITQQTLGELELLEPTGHENPAPVLLVPDAGFISASPMGEGRHFRGELEDGKGALSVFAFNQKLPGPGRYQVLLRPELDSWQGRSQVRGRIQSFKPINTEKRLMDECVNRPRFERELYFRLLSQAQNENLHIDEDILIDIEEFYERLYQASDSRFGTLLVACTREDARECVGILGAMGLRDAFVPCQGQMNAGELLPGYNAFVTAPRWDKVHWERYGNILFYGGITDCAALMRIKHRLPDAQIGIIMDEYNIAALSAAFKSAELSDDALRGIYRSARAGKGGADIEEYCSLVAAGAGVADWQAYMGLKVFGQLKLLDVLPKSPWIRLAESPPKVNLGDSRLYRAMRSPMGDAAGLADMWKERNG